MRTVGSARIAFWVIVLTAIASIGANARPTYAADTDQIRILVPGDGQPVSPNSAAAKLLRGQKTSRIPGLRFLSIEQELHVLKDPSGAFLLFVTARGFFQNGAGVAQRRLLIQNRSVGLSRAGEFKVVLPVTAEAQGFRVVAVDIRGKVEDELIVVDVPRWRQLTRAAIQKASDLAPKAPESLISVGLGYSSYRYQESGVGPFTEAAVTVKISFQRQLAVDSHFDLALNTFFTAAPISTTEASGRTVSFFGLNARLGYRTDILSDPWRLSIMGGVYYLTTSTSDSTFGFQNLTGPQIFPVIRRKLTSTSTVSVYAKYSPVGSGLSLEFGNREFASGISLVKVLGSTPLSFAFDYSNFSANIEGDQFQYSSYTFGFSVGF